MKKETVLFFIFSIFFATLVMGIIYAIILIVATQSLGIWSNLVGFLIFLSLLGVCFYFNIFEFEIKKEDVRE